VILPNKTGPDKSDKRFLTIAIAVFAAVIIALFLYSMVFSA
jgi:hypothetical protein